MSIWEPYVMMPKYKTNRGVNDCFDFCDIASGDILDN